MVLKWFAPSLNAPVEATEATVEATEATEATVESTEATEAAYLKLKLRIL